MATSEGALRQALVGLAHGPSFYLRPGLAAVGVRALDELVALRNVAGCARAVANFIAEFETLDGIGEAFDHLWDALRAVGMTPDAVPPCDREEGRDGSE